MSMDLPESVKASLWSYDIGSLNMDLEEHRTLVVFNVLNYGTLDAFWWLVKNFRKSEIQAVIRGSSVSSWSRKSLTLWGLVFDVFPEKNERYS